MDPGEWVAAHSRCPACHAGPLAQAPGAWGCRGCGAQYPLAGGVPVLLHPDNAVFPPGRYERASPARERATRRFAPTTVNLARRRVVSDLVDRLRGDEPRTVLVVGSGRQRGALDAQLAVAPNLTAVYCDVDVRAQVDCYADAHDLPFADGSCHGIVATAVLEHVMYPERVVAEFARVLEPMTGVVYSELPFMQQVHEGAYDFTRYTLSGHRRLFHAFAELDSGMVAGPATALAWAMEHFALALVGGGRSRLVAKALVRGLLLWLPYVDRFLRDRPAAMDGASCTYFFGRLANETVPDEEIVARYVGAQAVTHT